MGEIYKQVGKNKYTEYLYAMAEVLEIWKFISWGVEEDEYWVDEGTRLKVCDNSVTIFKILGMADTLEKNFIDMVVAKGIVEGLTKSTAQQLLNIIDTVTIIKCRRTDIHDRIFPALIERIVKVSEIFNFDEGVIVKTTNIGEPSLKFAFNQMMQRTL